MDTQTNLLKSGFLLVLLCAALSPTPTARAYEPYAHRFIVAKAAELYGQSGSSNEPLDYGLVIAGGAEHEDSYDHVFGYTLAYTTITHFWDGDKGPLGSVSLPSVPFDNENAFQKVTAYGTSEEMGLWQQALAYYKLDNKLAAYERLGHVSHLIADMSVPAHVHEHEHVVACAADGGDLYECLVSDNIEWLLEALDSEQLVDGLIPIPPGENSVQCDFCDPNKKPLLPLYYLMYTTNQRADFFASVYDWCAGPGWCPDETWGDLFDIHNYIWVNYLEYPFQMAYYQDPDHIKTDIWGCNNCGELLCIGGSQCAPCIYCGSYNVDHVEPSFAIAARCTLVHAVRATATLWELFVNIVADTKPPTTTLQMSDPKYYDGNDWHIATNTQLTLEATDANSGVNCTFYCISDSECDSNSTVYTGPFDLSKGPDGTQLEGGSYKIYYKSIDRAGNEEAEKWENVILGWVYNTTRQLYYTSIQAAIDDAVNGDEILAGPTSYNEAIDFKGKAISLRSSHGPENTIINGSGIAGVYHVVKCVSGENANTILEGFTITGGNANGSSPDDRGGGMYNDNSSPTITSCIFTGNKATFGGGILNFDCNPTVTNCNFENNTASGAIGGGGMYNHNSSPVLTDCTFSGNSGGPWGGGGMFNAASSNPTLINCTFSNNDAVGGGGGIYNWDDTMPILINCTFSGNSATEVGGGMFNISNSRPTVTGCSFNGNTSAFGGGIYSEGSSPDVTNCVFRDNSATNSGGGMCDSNSSPTITNCTFSDNSSVGSGGGMYNYNYSSPTVTNCILWGDGPNEILDVNSSTTVTYSDVQGGWPGTGNIDSPPLFENPDCVNFQLAFYSPCVDAGNNDAVPPDTTDLDGDGNTTELIPFDLAGNPRFVDDAGVPDTGAGTTPIVDMGAYERQDDSRAAKTIYVSDIPLFPDYNTIQEAINEAHSGDEIVVFLGLYNEAIDFLGKAITVRSTDPNDPIVVAQTIIDATGLGAVSVVKCRTCEGNDTILSGFTIRCGRGTYSGTQTYGGGMYNERTSPTITNCIFTGNQADHGGGMYNYQNSPTVTNCTFTYNRASRGSGMLNIDGMPTVTNCDFRNNFAWGSNGGGGMHNEGSSPEVINCIFNENMAEDGAGMYNLGSEPQVTNCTFTLNSSLEGGGMHNNQSSPTVTNCIFNENMAEDGAGMFFFMSGNPEEHPMINNCIFLHNFAVRGGGLYTNQSFMLSLTNCTFTDNVAWESGGAIYNEIGNILVTNSILWGDVAPAPEDSEIGGNIDEFFVNLSYCDIVGPFSGPTIIYADPCFVDVGGGNLRLSMYSPCIDAGSNDEVPADTIDLDGDDNTIEPIPFDLNGHPRFIDGDCNDTAIVDMGASEFNYAYTGDLDYNCTVNSTDFAIFAMAWLTEAPEPMWNQFCDIGIPPDDYIDWYDLNVLVENWLESF